MSEKHKFVFVRNHKAASTSISDLFVRRYHARFVPQQDYVFGASHSPRVPDRFLTPRWHRIAVVRNPYSRLVSWWHWLRHSDGKVDQHRGGPFMFGGIVHNEQWEFAEFVERITTPSRRPLLNRPGCQAEYLKPARLTRVLLHEQLPDCIWKLPFVKRRCRLQRKKPGRYGDWRSYYTAELAEMVAAWAAEDFKSYPYLVDSWSHSSSSTDL